MENKLTDELLNRAIEESRLDGWARCVQTRDGQQVRVYWFSKSYVHYAIPTCATPFACARVGDALIPAPREWEVWINVYEQGTHAPLVLHPHKSAESAESCGCSSRIARKRLVIREGDME